MRSDSSDDNVVSIESGRRVDPSTLDGIRDRLDAVREVFVEAVAEEIYFSVLESVVRSGFSDSDEDTEKDEALVYQAIKSLLMKGRGMSHPFQEIAEDAFEYDPSGEMVVRKVEK